MMEALNYMARTLSAPERSFVRASSGATTHAGVMLDAMRCKGTMTSAELAAEIGLSSTLVGPLLKHHVKSGRVIMDWNARGRRTWRICDGEADMESVRDAIRAAVVLLRRFGFTVTSDESKTPNVPVSGAC